MGVVSDRADYETSVISDVSHCTCSRNYLLVVVEATAVHGNPRNAQMKRQAILSILVKVSF